MDQDKQRATGRIVVIDPSCASVTSHHLQSLHDLAAALAPRTLEFLVHRDMPPAALPAGAAVRPVFTSTVYDPDAYGPRPQGRAARRLWKTRIAWGETERALAAGLAAVTATGSDEARLWHEDRGWARWRERWAELGAVIAALDGPPAAHIVAPSCDEALVCGLAELRSSSPVTAGAALHARMTKITPAIKRLVLPPNASSALRARHQERMRNVHIYAETPAMQRDLARLGLPADSYPYLLSPQLIDKDVPSTPPGRDSGRVTIGYFGGKRDEKGFHRLLPIIRLVAERRTACDPVLSFVIQASNVTGPATDLLAREFAAASSETVAIKLVAGPLAQAAYVRQLAEADMILLPYNGSRYLISGSGVLSEAILLEKPVVYQTGMSFDDVCTPAHAIGAADEKGFADAVLAMARSLEAYRLGAKDRNRAYRAELASSALLTRLKG